MLNVSPEREYAPQSFTWLEPDLIMLLDTLVFNALFFLFLNFLNTLLLNACVFCGVTFFCFVCLFVCCLFVPDFLYVLAHMFLCVDSMTSCLYQYISIYFLIDIYFFLCWSEWIILERMKNMNIKMLRTKSTCSFVSLLLLLLLFLLLLLIIIILRPRNLIFLIKENEKKNVKLIHTC